MTFVHKITLPDGSVATRKSAACYTHAVIVLKGVRWVVAGYCSNKLLADKLLTRRSSLGGDCRIVDVASSKEGK